jgi:inosose dehydratase
VSNVVIGTAPDSWGIWFAEDPIQTPAHRFLDEAKEAGYEWIEIGAYGYLPTDADHLNAELSQRGLKVSGGTTFAGLHHPDTLESVWQAVSPIAALTRATGAEHLVVIPDLWRDDLTGNEKESRDLTAEQWHHLTSGHNALGRRLWEEHGVRLQFHSHADSHVGYQADIERFLEATDPEYVNLCLDTGHVAYYSGDSIALMTKYPERVGYLHLKQVDAALAKRALAEDISFSQAVRMDIMVEPPQGEPNLAEVIAAAAELLPRDVFGIVEQDMYPCPPDKPLPIAKRTYTYLQSCRGVS